MEAIDLEQQEPFPVDRDDVQVRTAEDQPDGGKKRGCCENFQETVSRWMLPEDSRSKYLERANCCPPPIFIICISIAEVVHAHIVKTHKHWHDQYGSCDLVRHAAYIHCHGVNDCIDYL